MVCWWHSFLMYPLCKEFLPYPLFSSIYIFKYNNYTLSTLIHLLMYVCTYRLYATKAKFLLYFSILLSFFLLYFYTIPSPRLSSFSSSSVFHTSSNKKKSSASKKMYFNMVNKLRPDVCNCCLSLFYCSCCHCCVCLYDVLLTCLFFFNIVSFTVYMFSFTASLYFCCTK